MVGKQGRTSLCASRCIRRPGGIAAAVAAMAVATAFLPAAAWAQVAAPLPPSRTDLDPARSEQQRPAPSRLLVEGELERGPCPLADPAFAETRVTFSRVEFVGLPGVAPDVLDSAWAGMAGREMPLSALCEVRDRAAATLRAMGYLAAVQLPPQRIDAGGVVKMDVIAARLVEVQLRGEPGQAEQLLAAHLARLVDGEYFNAFAAERHLLLLEDLPGFDVRLILRTAQGAPGEVVGDVVITRRPVELAIGAQNFGPRATGRESGHALLALNDLTGMGDRTEVTFFSTADWDEQRVLGLSHSLALNADGLRLSGNLVLGWSNPDIAGTGGAFHTRTVAGDINLSWPVLRSRAQNIHLAGGLDIVDQRVRFGAVALSEDKLRVAYARVSWDATDPASIRGRGGFNALQPRWRAAMTAQVRQGLSILGASDDCTPLADCLAPNLPISNVAADPSAFVARVEGQIELRPLPDLTLAAAPVAQWSAAPLLSYEQLSLGNYTVGRGLDPGIAQGDSGVGVKLELRYGSLIPASRADLALEPFVFLDLARTWVDDDVPVADPRSVRTAGGGLRARWGDRADFSVLLAVPLARAGYQTARADPRLLFSVTTRLLPWGMQ